MTQTSRANLSLKIDFSVDGVQFTESLLATIQAGVEEAIRRSATEGMLTTDVQENAIVELKNVSHLDPKVNIILDGGRVDRISTNTEGVTINVIDDADVHEEENIFCRDGDHVYLYAEHTNSYQPEVSDIWSSESDALRILQDGNFLDMAKEDFIKSEAELKVRRAFHTDAQGWFYDRSAAAKGFIEEGFEVYCEEGECCAVVYRFASEVMANAAVKVWAEARGRLLEEMEEEA